MPLAQPISQRLVRYVPRLASEWDLDAPGQDWQEIDSTLCFVDLSGFTGIDLQKVLWVIFAASPAPGPFAFQIDEVRLR